MKIPLLTLTALLILPLAVSAAPKETVLIDLTEVHTDPISNLVEKNYEYAYETWNSKIIDLKGKGALVRAPSGKGGFGENKTLVRFGKHKYIDVIFVVGNANKAQNVSFSLEDKDGTIQNWNIPIGTLTTGVELRVRLDLEKSSNEEKPGTTPGLNRAKMHAWQIKGDWQEPSVEVLFVKVVAPKE